MFWWRMVKKGLKGSNHIWESYSVSLLSGQMIITEIKIQIQRSSSGFCASAPSKTAAINASGSQRAPPAFPVAVVARRNWHILCCRKGDSSRWCCHWCWRTTTPPQHHEEEEGDKTEGWELHHLQIRSDFRSAVCSSHPSTQSPFRFWIKEGRQM